MNTFYKIVVIIVTGAVLFIGYQNLVVIPKEKIEAEKAEARLKAQQAVTARLERETKYNSCMAEAYNLYNLDWNNRCKILEKEADCSLPQYLADMHDADLEKDQDRCVTMYK